MIGRDEAASALDSVARSRRHAAELRGYAGAGSTLIAYGLAWVAGNGTAQFAPAHAGGVTRTAQPRERARPARAQRGAGELTAFVLAWDVGDELGSRHRVALRGLDGHRPAQ